MNGSESNPFDNKLTTNSSWGDVRNYIATIKDNDPLGYKNYLNEILKAATDKYYCESDKIGNTDIINLSWNCFESSLKGDILKKAGIKFYLKGITYYHYWIEHEKNSSITMSNTKYAIVRNNIYRMTVNSINNVGEPYPYIDIDDGFDTPVNRSVVIGISVLDWNIINHSDIVMSLMIKLINLQFQSMKRILNKYCTISDERRVRQAVMLSHGCAVFGHH